MKNSKTDDFPEIGISRRGMVLVCHGDDRPTQFAEWLTPLLQEYVSLQSLASEHLVELRLGDGSAELCDEMDFCQRLGIEFSSKMWEGSLISGIYHIGWIKKGTARSAAAQGRQMLKTLKHNVDAAVRRSIFNELEKIKDLDELVDRTRNDRADQEKSINTLRASLSNARDALKTAQSDAERDTTAIDQACVEMGAVLLSGEKHRVVAGPLVLWDDGVVYALYDWGGVPIPANSTPSLLLKAIEQSGRPLVKVKEATVIHGWLNAVHRKGPEHIKGWEKVWSIRESRERNFLTESPETLRQVRAIHEHLSQQHV